MNGELFRCEPSRGFQCITADPPWPERGAGKSKRGADKHYPLMPIRAIRQMGPDVRRVAAANAHLWLWVTDTYLPDGLEVLKAWGFRYVRTLVWVKLTKAGDVHPGGLGQYARGAHELILLGVRGRLPVPTTGRSCSVISARRGRHSAKPNEFVELVERASPGPRLEIFGRTFREGWTVVGNETSGGDVRADLRGLAASLPTIAEPSAGELQG